MSRALSLAGFQVTLIGRIWVTPEVGISGVQEIVRKSSSLPAKQMKQDILNDVRSESHAPWQQSVRGREIPDLGKANYARFAGFFNAFTSASAAGAFVAQMAPTQPPPMNMKRFQLAPKSQAR
jgi:hypothetical protein